MRAHLPACCVVGPARGIHTAPLERVGLKAEERTAHKLL